LRAIRYRTRGVRLYTFPNEHRRLGRCELRSFILPQATLPRLAVPCRDSPYSAQTRNALGSPVRGRCNWTHAHAPSPRFLHDRPMNHTNAAQRDPLTHRS
jgi:hypothetical protein